MAPYTRIQIQDNQSEIGVHLSGTLGRNCSYWHSDSDAVAAVQAARETGRRAQCGNNFRQTALAVLAYESQKGVFSAGGAGLGHIRNSACGRLPNRRRRVISSAEAGPFRSCRKWTCKTCSTSSIGASASSPRPGRTTRLWRAGQFLPLPQRPDASELLYLTDVDVVSGWPSNGSDPRTTPRSRTLPACRTRRTGRATPSGAAVPRVNGMFGQQASCSVANVRDGLSNTLMLAEVTGGGPGSRAGFSWYHARSSTPRRNQRPVHHSRRRQLPSRRRAGDLGLPRFGRLQLSSRRLQRRLRRRQRAFPHQNIAAATLAR